MTTTNLNISDTCPSGNDEDSNSDDGPPLHVDDDNLNSNGPHFRHQVLINTCISYTNKFIMYTIILLLDGHCRQITLVS